MLTGDDVAFLQERPLKTVRHMACEMICTSPYRCAACISYRKTLFITAKKQKSGNEGGGLSSSPSMHTNLRFLSKNQMISTIKSLRKDLKQCNSKLAQLEAMIEHDREQQGITLDSDTTSDFVSIMREHHESIMSSYAENSFENVFWNNQKAAIDANPTSIRWHPTIIKWCIYLRHKSPGAYELLRKSKIIRLPSQRTLRSYVHCYDSQSGFSNELDEQLLMESKHQIKESYQKNVILIGDEMHIREDLVYDKSNGKLVGFCEMGEINDHLLTLEKQYSGTNKNKKLATTVLVVMVRGLFINLSFPYASFPSANLTGDQLIPIFHEANMRVERCGLNVLGITLDGNSVNRKFFKLIGIGQTDQIKHFTMNPMSMNKRRLLFFSDPPHLIKTARNCLVNRNMEVSLIINNDY